jgi:hypothetical protein
LFDQMLQPCRLEPGQFLGVLIVEREQGRAQRCARRYFGGRNRLQFLIAHAIGPGSGSCNDPADLKKIRGPPPMRQARILLIHIAALNTATKPASPTPGVSERQQAPRQ